MHAFVPTSHMPERGFPDGWNQGRQFVYDEDLPGFLDTKGSAPDQTRTVILLREGNHRVKDIWLTSVDSLREYKPVVAAIQPLVSLEELSLGNGETTSFYETSGSRKGYVKGSEKCRERLFMSWWAFDWRVGEDKKLGNDKNDGILFYTSLKPWDRETSDMRDFAGFLRYWKWKP
ncbi:MAG: hypothetical protein JEZ11_15250 [Desulfobacterales bacterium]|nr:hypothetical protein [Desulfobacterales bacterium]